LRKPTPNGRNESISMTLIEIFYSPADSSAGPAEKKSEKNDNVILAAHGLGTWTAVRQGAAQFHDLCQTSRPLLDLARHGARQAL